MENQTSKRFRIVILIYAICTVLSGLFHMFSPQTVVAQDQAIERVLGGAMLAFALGAWLASKERSWEKIRITLLMLVAWTILYTITLAWGVLSGGLLVQAWGATIFGAVLALLLTILYIRENRLRNS